MVIKMTLIKNKTPAATATPAFEGDDDSATTTATTTATATSDTKATDVKSETAVAVKPSAALAVASKVDLRVMDSFKNAMVVDYNTLSQIIATNGNFVDRESKTIMGDTVVFTLLSFQDSYVVSPNDDNAADELVKYSNDGKTCSDGTDVQEHLAFLKENGFPKASLKQRVVVVAAVESAAKTDKFNGTLMQLDLSPASRTQWMRYTANVAYGLSVGKFKPEQVSRVKAETVLSQKGTDTFTLVQFSVA
jgi:hypothetical protein